jgi:DedD protein
VDRTHLKQRIVGAIVLVALGVIFIPIILNRDDSHTGITGSNIPKKPRELAQLAEQSVPPPPPAPVPPAQTRQLVDKDTPALPKATQDLTKATKTSAKPQAAPGESNNKSPVPDAVAKTRGWVVQIASFTDRNKALKLRNRLLKAKYNCFVESITGKRGTLYRVRVGPVIKRAEAKTLQTRLAKRLKLKGTLVMAYP